MKKNTVIERPYWSDHKFIAQKKKQIQFRHSYNLRNILSYDSSMKYNIYIYFQKNKIKQFRKKKKKKKELESTATAEEEVAKHGEQGYGLKARN